jgi:predicted permease
MRLRRLIVVSEIALSILLVIGAGLMVRSFQNLLREDPGFDAGNLLFARFSLPAADYEPEEAVLFFDGLLDRTRGLSGVTEASLISRPPLLWHDQGGRFHIDGRPVAPSAPMCCVSDHVVVGSGAFETMGIPLLQGRLFDDNDHRVEAESVVIVDQELARRYWPEEDPIGEHVRFGSTEAPLATVVGVVGSVTFDGPGEFFPHHYVPHNQTARSAPFITRSTYLVVRTTGDPSVAVGSIREIVRDMDPGQAIASTYTMSDIETRAVARPRFLLSLLGVFAAVALILGAIGIYGVMSHGVAQRVDEIGIRRALGAEAKEVVRMVVRQGLSLTGLGVVVGLGAAFLATRVMASFLHEVSATDPWTFGLVALGVVAVALLASWVPARRASRIDPMEALRVE